MNIKFSSDAVRCRATHAEFESLLAGRAISLEVALPRNHAFKASVRPAPVGGWLLDSDPTGLWIAIPRAALESLAEKLPSKEGISNRFEMGGKGSVAVSFEVDVRKSDEVML